jgi:hypothetical protein
VLNQRSVLFNNGQCQYGIYNNTDIYRISEENRKALHKNLNGLEIYSRKETNWGPFYACFPNLSLETWETEIINSDTFLDNCEQRKKNY